MGFEQLKNIIDANKKQAEIDKEEAMNPILCPDCDWILTVNSNGEKSCPMCEMVWR